MEHVNSLWEGFFFFVRQSRFTLRRGERREEEEEEEDEGRGAN